jgi:hypothetical protein
MDKEFKVWYDKQAASQDYLDAIEEITVEQEVGRAWEARIKIPVSIGEDGSWDKEGDPAYQKGVRVRVEASIGNGQFKALIDGSIVSRQPDYNAAPGISTLTLIVHDDTAKLHLKVEPETYAERTEKEIIEALFESGNLGGETDIDDPPAAPDANVVINRHGTSMETLRSITARYRDLYAYVLPGSSPGTSDGFFKPLPTEPDEDLDTLYLEGPDRNMSRFSIQENSNRAATFESQALSMKDKSITSVTSAAVTPAEGEAATDLSAEDIRHRRIPPGEGDLTDPQEAVDRAAKASSFTLSAEGSVLPSCYPSILMPYKRVPVRLSNTRYSASYVIFKVTHTLGRSEYTQSFSMRGDAVSPSNSSSASAPAASAAAGALAAAFNIQADIF